MKIDPAEVAKVAQLASLTLDESRTVHFAGQLTDILEHMEHLNELDTTDIEPLYTPVDHHTVLRSDTVQREYDREQILDNAPASDGSHFIVPKVV